MTDYLSAAGIVAGMPVDMSWYGMGVQTVTAVESNGKFTGFRFEGDPSLYSMYTSTGFKRCPKCAVWVPANTDSMHIKACDLPRCRVLNYTERWASLTDTTRIVVRPGQLNHTGTCKSHVVEQIWAQLRSNGNELYIPVRNP